MKYFCVFKLLLKSRKSGLLFNRKVNFSGGCLPKFCFTICQLIQAISHLEGSSFGQFILYFLLLLFWILSSIGSIDGSQKLFFVLVPISCSSSRPSLYCKLNSRTIYLQVFFDVQAQGHHRFNLPPTLQECQAPILRITGKHSSKVCFTFF